MLEAHEQAVRYFQASLMQNGNALAYVVKKRHLNRQTVKDFQVGYAPDSWNALTDFLTSKGFTPHELLKAGLAGQKEGRSTIYDFFRGRVMFTICDRDGRPIGFTARVLDDSMPKYLNTPQTGLYDKSHAIFGLHLAKEAIRTANEVVLVEGNMDVIASHQAGVRQVVAASGTALTLDQLRTLSKLTKNIKLAFDADRAGLAATERAIELGQKLGLTLRMVEIPGAKDADELIQQDPAAWTQAIAGAKYIVDYLFDRFERDFDLSSAIGKRQYTDRLAANLRRLGDPVEQDHYIKLLAEKVGVDSDAVKAKVLEQSSSLSTSSSTDQAYTPVVEVESPRAVIQAQGRPGARVQLEKLMLALVLTYPLTRISLDDLGEHDFSSPEHKSLYRALRTHRDEPGETLATTLTELSQAINILLLVGERQFAETAPADRSIEAFELARRLRTASNQDLTQTLRNQLREAQTKGDVQLELSLLGQLQAINEEEV
jgi:DNA primase